MEDTVTDRRDTVQPPSSSAEASLFRCGSNDLRSSCIPLASPEECVKSISTVTACESGAGRMVGLVWRLGGRAGRCMATGPPPSPRCHHW